MEQNNLFFTLSGIRGIVGKEFNPNIVKKIVIAYGLWFEGKDKRIIIGRDTRPSGKKIEKAVIEGLIVTGFKIINVGICPTPIIIHAKNNHNIPGGIIITGSHNPQEWNGLKLLSKINFLKKADIEQIKNNSNKIDLNSYSFKKRKVNDHLENLNPYMNYIQDLYKYIDYEYVKNQNNLKVVVDTGAGAGKFATPQILEGLGCKVKLVNNNLLVNGTFPRGIEPIEKNLRDLIMEVWQRKFDIGFAHDSDADRLALVGDDGVCYPEDIGLALITDYYLKKYYNLGRDVIFVTNVASSLRFEALAEKYSAKIIRTPIGERFLTARMDDLIEEESNDPENRLVFGGEGSCGGIMFPYFNKTRDGIFAAAKIIEILVETGKKISDLVSLLPRYFSHRKNINIKHKDIKLIIELVKKELTDEGEYVEQIDQDLRIGKGNKWFILIHPSNTEPIIRVISEAKRESLARVYCEVTTELIRLIIKRI
jgi:phosphomannomutase